MENYEKYVGMIFDGRYRIQRIIGLGGMAVVFEAEDLLMHRTVAVKMLKEGVGDDATSVKRFINESKAVSMLSHPNIVSIYDVSVREDLKYIVMEHIRGITLKNYMSRKGKLPVREAVSFTEQILRALDHAHSKGIIHRDIKPQNIMLLKNGMIKVADFGIAKLPSVETVTVTDKAIGTVYYISPEQASGKPIDPRSDLYSVGVMLYEMVTGTLPFSADSPVSVALMQIHNTPRPPRALCPELPLGLQQIILRAMEKDPDRRYQSAREMLRHIVALKNNPDTIFNLSGAQKEEEEEDPMPMRKRKEKATMLPIITGVLTAFLLGDAAKIQSGELILNPAPFDFSEMTTQILLSFEQKIEKKKLDVQCELDERLTVMGDRDHLYRAVYNLTDNAVKFIDEGGTLRLRAHPEGSFCVFSISNTGMGISAEDLPHVFDRFYKADRSRSMDKTGAGLGLYIVKNIINLHGGEISVRSDGGETEFEFTLPLAPEQNRANDP